MQELISVIVPVYNTAAYLEDCIRSVLAQSWTRFELLLVDDGSGDESASICQSFCEKDSRVRFLQQAHAGVSAARNRALREAKGNYLFFLDSDDAIHPRLLEALLQLAKEYGAAVAQADGQCVFSEELRALLQSPDAGREYPGLYLENRRALELFIHDSAVFLLFTAIGGKLICRSALEQIAFDETLPNAEDTKLIYQLLFSGADMVVLRRKWYYYRMHTENASKRLSRSVCKAHYEYQKYACEQEKKAGRLKNAARCECSVVYLFLEWYRQSRKNRDGALREYLEELAGAEQKSCRFSLLPFHYKVIFHIAFSCYPVYQYMIFPLLLLRRKWMERRQKRN